MHRKDQIVFRRCTAALLSAPLLAFLVPATAVAQDARLADTAKEASNRTLIADAFARWSAGTGNVFSLLADDVVWHITASIRRLRRHTKAVRRCSTPRQARCAVG
jgi:hypothetical protein